MRTLQRAAMLAATVALLTSGAAMAESPSPESPAPVAPAPAPQLAGPTWFLGSYLAEDGGYTGPASPATIRFGAEVSGSTGCNDFHGPWTQDGTDLSIGPLIYSARACTSTNTGQDMAVRASLAEVAGYRLRRDGELDLLDASGNIRLGYRTLEGWTWVPMYGGDEPTPAAIVTVAFLDGTVSGQAPCNQFSAPYTLDGTTLSVGPIATTRMACPDLALEQDYLTTLAAARAWAIDAGDLVLLDAQGGELRRFAAATTGD
jgi:heat shock protein HslJ